MAKSHLLLATLFVAYAFIAGISCAVILLDSANGEKNPHPGGVTQCLDEHGTPLMCPAFCTDCGFLKCSKGVYAGDRSVN